MFKVGWIFTLLRYTPDIIRLIKEIFKIKDEFAKEKKKTELKEASKLAIKGDTSGYEKLFNGSSTPKPK